MNTLVQLYRIRDDVKWEDWLGCYSWYNEEGTTPHFISRCIKCSNLHVHWRPACQLTLDLVCCWSYGNISGIVSVVLILCHYVTSLFAWAHSCQPFHRYPSHSPEQISYTVFCLLLYACCLKPATYDSFQKIPAGGYCILGRRMWDVPCFRDSVGPTAKIVWCTSSWTLQKLVSRRTVTSTSLRQINCRWEGVGRVTWLTLKKLGLQFYSVQQMKLDGIDKQEQ